MHVSRSIAIAFTGTGLLVACANHDITSIDAGHADFNAAAASMPVADMAGTWHWSTIEEVAFPPFLAALLGVAPEGDLTHGVCASSGSMQLEQAGTAFHGTALREFNTCTTRGGQPFGQPGLSLVVAEGRVTGRAIHFDMYGTAGPCPHHATISSLEAGTARAVKGKGMCRLPGHPHSEAPIQSDPPPQGYARTTLFEALRP